LFLITFVWFNYSLVIIWKN